MPKVHNSLCVSIQQWSGGGGRDSDVDLMALTRWWFDRRDQCRAITTTSTSDGASAEQESSLPPRDEPALESFWAQG